MDADYLFLPRRIRSPLSQRTPVLAARGTQVWSGYSGSFSDNPLFVWISRSSVLVARCLPLGYRLWVLHLAQLLVTAIPGQGEAVKSVQRGWGVSWGLFVSSIISLYSRQMSLQHANMYIAALSRPKSLTRINLWSGVPVQHTNRIQ